jgi:hypothetical protein
MLKRNIRKSAYTGQVKIMSIATDILSLRQNQASSVETLMAKIEWLEAAREVAHVMTRGFAVREAADDVLTKVAVYAAEALSEPPAIRRTRPTGPSSWRKRHFNPGQLHQRRLFAPTAG